MRKIIQLIVIFTFLYSLSFSQEINTECVSGAKLRTAPDPVLGVELLTFKQQTNIRVIEYVDMSYVKVCKDSNGVCGFMNEMYIIPSEELKLKKNQYISWVQLQKSMDLLEEIAYSKECHFEKTVDDFDGEITYRSEKYGDISFIKCINKKVTNTYLSIYIEESGIYTGTGVCLILDNGNKINRPLEEVEYAYIGGSFYTKIFMKLTTNEISLLKQSGIKKYKLYISKGECKNPEISKNIFNCIINCK